MYQVLIVDDETLTCKALSSIVSGVSGFQVAGCLESGEEAVEFCSKNDVHIIFMDIALPGMTGIDAAVKINKTNPSSQIFIISALSGFSIIKKTLSSRIRDYLVKPISISDVRNLLENYRAEQEGNEDFSLRLLESIHHRQYREMLDEIPLLVHEIFHESRGNTDNVLNRFAQLVNHVLQVLGVHLVETRRFTGKTLEGRFPVNRVYAREEIWWNFWFSDVMNAVYWKQIIEKHDFLQSVSDFIDAEIKNDISLSSVCQACSISQSYLSKLFRKHFGISVMDYIHLRKLGKAKMYIALSDYTMTQIGHHAGYNDGSYFSKIFKKYEGMTPKQYKTKYCVKGEGRKRRHE